MRIFFGGHYLARNAAMAVALLFIIILSSFSHAAREYAPAVATYGGKLSPGEYCAALPTAGYYRAKPPFVYQTSGYYTGQCCMEATDPYNKVYHCNQQYNVYVRGVPTPVYQCPPGYTWDNTKDPTDPQACYFDPPVDDDQTPGDPSNPDSTPPDPVEPSPPAPDMTPPPPSPADQGNQNGASGGSSSAPCNANSGVAGDPINTANGNKFATIVDYQAAGVSPLRFVRYYDSQMPVSATLGSHWSHGYERTLELISSTSLKARRPNGSAYAFTLTNGAWTAAGNVNLRLQALDAGQGWQLTTAQDETETYDAQGHLLQIISRGGITQSLAYNTAGQLISVTDSLGHVLRFDYNSAGRLVLVTNPAGNLYRYDYDAAGNLHTFIGPDGRTLTYHYDNPSFPHALTSVVDGNGVEIDWTFYDSQGRAYQNGRGGDIDKVSIGYDNSGTNATVTNSNNTSQSYTFQLIQGVLKATGLSRTCPTCTTAVRRMERDDNGNITSVTDFNGIRTSYQYDLARNLETSRTEAVGTPVQRTVSTEWHPTFHVPTKITEPGRVTAMEYDDNGNMKSLSVTDAATGETRTWGYIFNSAGLLTSRSLPSGEDVTYAYDANGNLQTATTSGGLVTQYADYDANGHVGKITYPSGRTVAFTYDPAGRLQTREETVAASDSSDARRWWQIVLDWLRSLFGKSRSWPIAPSDSGVATTHYRYDNAGLLIDITLPDGQVLHYEYDPSYRLILAKDALGNTARIIRDPMGKPQEVQLSDPSGVLAQTLHRQYDELGRLSQVLGNSGQSLTLHYDEEGYLVSQLDALGRQRSQERDALYRTRSQTDADNQITRFDFNPLDQLTAVTDARGNTTTYSPNAFGEVTAEQSPDRSQTVRVYTQGHLTSSTDARGITHTFTYDANGRVSTVKSPEGTVTYRYDEGEFGGGRLTGIEDKSGDTRYSYNSQGEVTGKVSSIRQGPALQVSYGYTLGGQLKAVATPGKHLIEYSYDAQGRPAGVSVDGELLLSQMHFGPAGITGWTWSDGESRDAAYDQDGRVTQITSGSALSRQYGYDLGDRLTSLLDAPAGVNDRYGYDALDRLLSQQGNSASTSYRYDALGNRTYLQSGQGKNSAMTYQYDPSSNHLISTSTGSKTQNYFYLPSGQLSTNGTATYSYNDEGRLTDVRGQRPLHNDYNALGQRVRKVGQGVLVFAYDEAGHLLGEYTPGGVMVREYVWLGNRLVGMLSQQEKHVLYVHTDHLGTPRAVSDGETVLWRWEGEAFGSSVPDEQVAGPSLKFAMPLRFPGQYYDSETGINYNYFRDYSPAMGRYIESDPIGLEGGGNPYAYVGGNPLRYVDPYGLDAVLPFPSGGAIGDVLWGIGRAGLAGLGTGAGILTGALWPSSLGDGTLHAERPPGYWQGDAGAAEWGRRNDVGAREGRGRFHGIKQSCPGSRATDDWSTNPETGDVIDPNGDSWGNLGDVKSK